MLLASERNVAWGGGARDEDSKAGYVRVEALVRGRGRCGSYIGL